MLQSSELDNIKGGRRYRPFPTPGRLWKELTVVRHMGVDACQAYSPIGNLTLANNGILLREKVTLIADSSFKSNTFGTQAILTPMTSDSPHATLDRKQLHIWTFPACMLLLQNVQIGADTSWSWRHRLGVK